MRAKNLILGLICLFVFSFCKSPADPEIEKALNPDLPIIKYFTVAPSQILWGESFEVAWHVSDENWQISNAYWSIIDNSGALWIESTRIDNPWEPHVHSFSPDNLGDWTECPLTTFTLRAKNDAGAVRASCSVEVASGFAEVVMAWGPTGYVWPNSYIYTVSGGVKNIGSLPALNPKVSVELWGCYGNLLASGECLVGGDGFVLPPQPFNAGWQIKFDDTDGILLRQMNSTSEIKYEVTWDE